MLTCVKCNRRLAETKFFGDKKARNGYQSWCRECKSEGIRAYNGRRYAENRRRALAMFNNKCARCGKHITTDNPCQYNFHHTDSRTKEVSVSLLYLGPWEPIARELELCVLLDTGCHRIAHTKESDIWCE